MEGGKTGRIEDNGRKIGRREWVVRSKQYESRG